MVNYIYSNSFPHNESAYGNIALILNNVLLKAHLRGIAAYQGEFTEFDVVKCVQSYTKATEHSPIKVQLLQNKIDELKVDKFPLLLMLIQD